jgi:hypothetical protein
MSVGRTKAVVILNLIALPRNIMNCSLETERLPILTIEL